jgi:molybdopterin biosynthesis enzyme MoaB
MPIKTGLLCIPTYDEAAVDAVRRVLAQHVPGFLLLAEQRASMQRNLLEDLLCRWCDEDELDLVVTIGGTLPAPGPSGREIVPEATLAVAERQLPGLAEAMRAHAEEELPLAIMDRSVAAIRGRTLLLNLPAGAVAAQHFLEGVVEAISAVVAHLQEDPHAPQLTASEAALPEATHGAVEPPPAARSGLDAGEFAAFLKRPKRG